MKHLLVELFLPIWLDRNDAGITNSRRSSSTTIVKLGKSDPERQTKSSLQAEPDSETRPSPLSRGLR
jgi:hypothetical protein